ncbi:endonuclease/exonuclease/phosphatase family protein [Flavivirga spongiicola]|uniref:Endonuclease/exonuclease/phosphatase family protein n=1 Tax=Flavivirga spongiicola TaxID=421621 RepID=A0ABU7XTC4_9FLAO|nr:endonuclease/exonuclease/phosphatase family protein [Flavivirga sp. MEBiC05379]MDO5979016.1 endonuclease/exonuclease/phosphatase family protein [Flavivirga sp. MEBiC05379]
MKKRFNSTLVIIFSLIIIGFLSFGFINGSKRLASKNKTIKVLSYNIHYGLGMDKKYDLARIAKIISDQDPDIVGLQEIGDSIMAATLGKLTGMHYIFGPSKETMKGYGDAVLSKHPFEWVANYSIPSASSSRYQVMGVDVDLSAIYEKGTKVRFLNTHFDWTQSIGSQEARLSTVDVIERGFLENNNLPLILTGDLNAEPNSEPLKKLKKKGWVNKEGGEELFTIPVVSPDRQIDYVLVRPKKSWEIVDVKVLNEPVASDHLPVLMTLELR